MSRWPRHTIARLPGASEPLTLMGVLNVTPDSFSDGGRWDTPEAAVDRGLELVSQGAHIVDVGGESTRPGAESVSVQQQIERVAPVIQALSEQNVAVSVDTTRADVAAAGLDAGAAVINDVSGGLEDPEILQVVADRGCPYIVMHWRGPSRDMDKHQHYNDVVSQVRAHIDRQLDSARNAGVDQTQLVADFGFGFAKDVAQNWQLMAGLQHLVRHCTDAGVPVLVGTSRKRFVAAVTATKNDASRDRVTAMTSMVAAQAGAWAVRVHNVAASRDAGRVAAALRGDPKAWQA